MDGWVQKYDPKTKRHYYIDVKNRKTQWKKPEGWDEAVARASKGEERKGGSAKGSSQKGGVWIKRQDKSGKYYFINPLTKQSKWTVPPEAIVMTMEEFEIYRQRRIREAAATTLASKTDGSGVRRTVQKETRLQKIKRLFAFDDESDWCEIQTKYEFDPSMESDNPDMDALKMTYTIERLNNFGIAKDFILELKWNERRTQTDWRKMGHMYLRKEGNIEKELLLAEVANVKLDKFDDTRCVIQFRPPHYLSHVEQFKFVEEEPFKMRFKIADDRKRFIHALKYARLKAIEIMEAEREKAEAQEKLSNAALLKHGNLASWPVAMMIGTKKILNLKCYWKNGTDCKCMLVFKDTTGQRTTRLSMFSKDFRKIEFGTFKDFGLEHETTESQFRGVVAMRFHHSSPHIQRQKNFVFLFENKSELLDFTYHAVANLGDAIEIANPLFYGDFNRKKARFSKHAKPDLPTKSGGTKDS